MLAFGVLFPLGMVLGVSASLLDSDPPLAMAMRCQQHNIATKTKIHLPYSR